MALGEANASIKRKARSRKPGREVLIKLSDARGGRNNGLSAGRSAIGGESCRTSSQTCCDRRDGIVMVVHVARLDGSLLMRSTVDLSVLEAPKDEEKDASLSLQKLRTGNT